MAKKSKIIQEAIDSTYETVEDDSEKTEDAIPEVKITGYNEYLNTGGVLYLRDKQRILPNEEFVCKPSDLTSAMKESVKLLTENVEVELVEGEEE